MDSAAIVKVIECLISPPKACNGKTAVLSVIIIIIFISSKKRQCG